MTLMMRRLGENHLPRQNREPLRATIKKDEQTGAIIVARIMRGGAADRSGLIHIGDEFREVNGIPVEGNNPGNHPDLGSSLRMQ